MKVLLLSFLILGPFNSAISQNQSGKFKLGLTLENPSAIYPWNFHSQSYFDHPQRKSKPSTVEFHLGYSVNFEFLLKGKCWLGIGFSRFTVGLIEHQQAVSPGTYLDFAGRATYNTFPLAFKYKFKINDKLSIHPFIQLSIFNFISKSRTIMTLKNSSILNGKVVYPVPYCLQLGAFMEYKLSNKFSIRGGIYWNQVYNNFFEADYKTYEDVKQQDSWTLGSPFVAIGFGMYYSFGKK